LFKLEQREERGTVENSHAAARKRCILLLSELTISLFLSSSSPRLN
jgi:hypothetical protein